MSLVQCVALAARVFIRSTDQAAAIREGMSLIGTRFGASRVYVFEYAADGATMSNTHEWCAPGVSHQIQILQGLPTADFPWWTAKLRAGEDICIPDVSAMPPEAAAEQAILEVQDIQSLLVLPLWARDRLFGFVGFDNVLSTRTWTAEESEVLHVFTDLLASSIERDDQATALRESRSRLAAIGEATQDGIWEWDLVQGTSTWSNRFLDLLGHPPGSLLEGRDLLDLVHPADRAHVEAARQAHLDGASEAFACRCRMLLASGAWGWFLCRGRVTRDDTNQPVRLTGSIADITVQRAAEQRAIHDALHDGLTGLPNRTLFMERLRHCLTLAPRRGRELLGVLLLDLDDFKYVNDSLGHTAGDRLLCEAAARIQGCLRVCDSVARVGGDEFAILLEGLTGVHDATRAATRVLRGMAAPFRYHGNDLFLSTSIGIATNVQPYESAEDLLRDADTALYRARASNRAGYAVFNQSMHDEVRARVQLEADLRKALGARELQVFFQPIVDLESRRICGAEALARWNHPTLGYMSPAVFIPLCEETGLILSVGRWILTLAAQVVADWIATSQVPPDFYVAVNFSPRQFLRDDMVAQVREVLDLTGLAPRNLKCEITESLLLKETAGVLAQLQGLRDLGVQVLLDDFGTGYSSLAYLQRFPIDGIKIDRAFTGQLPDQEEVVRAITLLASSLGLYVVAEGVENDRQLSSLRTMAARYAQGFLFAPGLEPGAFASLLSTAPSW